MKKLMIVAAMAIVAAGFTACGNGTPKANLKSDVDSMSYAIGMAQTQGLKDYLVDRLGVDTAYMGEFIKGLNEGANAGDNKKKAAYYAGMDANGDMSLLVNTSLLWDGERVIGRLPQFRVKANFFDLFGKNFIGVGSDDVKAFNDKAILLRMERV